MILTLGITMGDPTGIGPKALAEPAVREACRPVVIGDARVLAVACRLASAPLEIRPIVAVGEARWAARHLEVVDLANVDPPAFAYGPVSPMAGRAAYEYTRMRVELALGGEIDGLVTGPISKEALAAAGFPHTGHTEILAELTGARDAAMLLIGRGVRAIHATTHVALRRVPDLVTPARVLRTSRLADEAMRRLGIAAPRLGVAGLNPHAGEEGLFGDEEARAIRPAIAEARALGIEASGPYPGDTLMSRARSGEFDCVVAMYHDQGHVAVKTLGFEYDEGAKTRTRMATPESMGEAPLIAARLARRSP